MRSVPIELGYITSVGLITIILVLAPTAAAYAGGITGKTNAGCTCHNPEQVGSVKPSISGVPKDYKPGQVYTFTVLYSGGPPPGAGSIAGFNLKASDGKLFVPDGSDQVRVDGATGEATHSGIGSRSNSWDVEWRAPAKADKEVTLTLVINVVNGDGTPGPSDVWGRRTMSFGGEEQGLPTGILTLTLAIVLIVVVIGIFVHFVSKKLKVGSNNRPMGRSRRR
jgi:hypothetical protein